MRGLLIRSAAAGALCLAIPVVGGAQGAASRTSLPQIVTSGSGESRIAPDRATIFIGVQTRAATAAQAGTGNATRQRAILDTLRALGLTGRQLSTIDYNVSPEMKYTPNSAAPPQVTGYVVRNTVRAEVNNLDDVGRIIDGALAKGANEISGLQFFSSKADSVRRVALGLAVANARADAEALAVAAGGKLGPLLELSSSSSGLRPPQPVMMSRAAEAKSTPVESGEQSFSAGVTARWTFVP